MKTIKDMLDTVTDPELHQWFTDFFIKRYGIESLGRDPMQWYSELGCTLYKLNMVEKEGVMKFTSDTDPLRVIMYSDSFGSYLSESPITAAFYGLISKLGHSPHWYEEY